MRSLLIWPKRSASAFWPRRRTPRGVSSMRPPCCSISPASASDLVRLARRSRARAASSPMCCRTWSRSISPRAAGVEARLEDLLHAVELAQLGGQVGGPVHAHRALAVEVVGALPAGVGHGALEVLGQALDLPAQVHVLEHGLHELAQLGLLLGAERVPHRLGGGHALGQLLEQLVEVLRVAREHVAVLRHELLEARVEVLAALALLEHLVQRVVGVAHPRHLLGVHVGERVGGALEEGVGHLAAQLLDQLLEALAGLGGDEVVVLQRC